MTCWNLRQPQRQVSFLSQLSSYLFALRQNCASVCMGWGGAGIQNYGRRGRQTHYLHFVSVKTSQICHVWSFPSAASAFSFHHSDCSLRALPSMLKPHAFALKQPQLCSPQSVCNHCAHWVLWSSALEQSSLLDAGRAETQWADCSGPCDRELLQLGMLNLSDNLTALF